LDEPTANRFGIVVGTVWVDLWQDFKTATWGRNNSYHLAGM
jgi:hypothetical protein